MARLTEAGQGASVFLFGHTKEFTMKIYKLTTFVVVSMLVAILLASALNNFTRVSDSAFAHIAPTSAPRANAPVAIPTAKRDYLPIVFLNAPGAVNCLYTTNGIAGGTVCNGDITLSLTAGGVITTSVSYTVGLQANNMSGLPGSAGLFGKQGTGSGLVNGAAGVWGDSSSNKGVLGSSVSDYGVYGVATSGIGVGGSSDSNSGVYGTSNTGTGVYGFSNSYGVVGRSISASGIGTGGLTPGVWGDSNSQSGVIGTSNSETGMYGASNSGIGVLGFSTTNIGVVGFSNAVGVRGSGPLTGVVGIGLNTGVYGFSASGFGVYGTSDTGRGVTGLWGALSPSSSLIAGVYGESGATSGNGVVGIANVGSSAWGVYGQSTSGIAVRGNSGGNASGPPYAGYFNGPVYVTGALTKAGGGFKIDHPLDPANQYLYHSFVESPDMKNIYDGIVVLDAKGEAWAELPAWFEAVNRDFRYQLTSIGAYAPVYVAREIFNNRFQIAGGKAGQKISWQVTGIRHDPWAEQYRVPVEEFKSAQERGRYLHPQLYGKSHAFALDAK